MIIIKLWCTLKTSTSLHEGLFLFSSAFSCTKWVPLLLPTIISSQSLISLSLSLNAYNHTHKKTKKNKRQTANLFLSVSELHAPKRKSHTRTPFFFFSSSELYTTQSPWQAHMHIKSNDSTTSLTASNVRHIFFELWIVIMGER